MKAPKAKTPAPISIVEALDDAHLFSGMMDGASWRPWRAFLAALFALPMDEGGLALYRYHTGRVAPPAEPFRAASLIIGRRGGKSRALGLIAAFLAVLRDHTPYLAPGEVPVIAVIAKDRDQAKVCLSYVVGTLRAIPALAGMIDTVQVESVTLTNGVVIEIHTASISAPRGRTFIAVLADETAFWPATGDSANPDIEVINAVRPGLTTIPYSLLLIASSPYARRGVLYSNYAKFFGRDDARTLVWKGSTIEMNSTLADDPLIADAYAEDVERADAEYGGNFRSDIVAFITREAVQEVIAQSTYEIPPGGGISYSGFVDPSGGSADSFTLAIGHVEPDGTAVLDALRERKPPFSPDDVVQEFTFLLKRYGINRITGDNYAGAWPKERFANHGITYEPSLRNKNQIYTEFLPALNGRRIRLLDIPRLTAQLIGLERRVARGGRDSIDHAPGSHDDVANVAAGVLVGLLDDRRPTLIQASDMRVDNEPVEAPRIADVLFSVVIVKEDGMTAAAHFAFTAQRPDARSGLVLLDFSLAPYCRGTIEATMTAQAALARETRPTRGRVIYIPEVLRQHFHASGYPAIAIEPSLLGDPAGLALSCAGPIAAGKVKIATKAAKRAVSSPLGGALDFKAGDDIVSNPLRIAVLVGVASAFVRESAKSGPVPRADAG